MQEANARRSALLLHQFEFLQTRQHAYEQVMMEWANSWRGFGLLKLVFAWPEFVREWDQRQKDLMAEAKRRMDEAQQKTKINPITLATH